MRALRTSVWIPILLFVTLSICQAKTNYAYVANYSDGNVSVINTSNNTVVKTITVGTNPAIVAVNQAGTLVYVTNSGSSNVSVISTSTNTVTATITVGSRPVGVAFAPNGKTAYVANYNSDTVSVINTGTKKVIATVSGLPSNPTSVAVTPNGAFAYVADLNAKSVSVISALTNAIVATVSLSASPEHVAISPDGSTAYVACGLSNSVVLIRTADNIVLNTISLSHSADGEAVSPDGHWLYVTAANSDDVVSVIDTGTQSVTATIVVGSSPENVAFTQDSAFAYVTDNSSGDVDVINTASQTVVKTISGVAGGLGVAVMGTVKASTVVGGYVGDKGPATSAALETPYSSVLDSGGNLYISDFMGNRIRKVDTTGKITTYTGTGICGYSGEGVKASLAEICLPNQLLFDSAGNLIVAGGTSRIHKISKTGVMTTIAGTGVYGYSGDGGAATQAEIGQPYAMTYDASGDLIFADVGECVVRKVDTSGNISTVAGNGTCGFSGDSGPATSAELYYPRGIALDTSGNIYIGDSQNHRVRKVDTSGTITTFAGTGQGGFSGDGGPATSAKVGNPHGLQVLNGVLYIASGGASRVRMVNLSSQIINTYAGSSYGYDGDGNSLLATRFTGPQSLEFDASGNPIFNDAFNSRVRKATGGIVNTIAGGFIGDGNKATSSALVYPEAMAIDKAGNIYIADEEGNRIREISGGTITTIAGTGINGYSGDSGPATSAQINEPYGVAVDSLGNVYISDSFNGVVRKVTSGVISTFATNANFGYLASMATDTANNLYIVDNGACVVWKITSGGMQSVVAGVLFTCGYNGDGIAATSAYLSPQTGLAIDNIGDILIADTYNSRLRMVDTSGIIHTIAGDGNCNYSGDGGSAAAAEMCLPWSIAVDKSGTIYFSDTNYGRIREIKGGVITPFAGILFNSGGISGGFVGCGADGLWPLYTTLDDAVAIAVDSKGTVYELDDIDHRVRAIK